MDKELFYEIILFAEEKGLKDHLGMLPAMPFCHTSALSLAKTVFWQRRYEIIFNRDFGKVIFGEEEYVTETNGVWCDGRKLATSIKALQHSINKIDDDKIKTLKRFGRVLVSDYLSYEITNEKFIGDWTYHLHMMVLAKDPFKYLEQEYKRIK